MYYIYHIPGVKIGCSINPDRRVKQQGYTDYIILEQHIDKYEAGKREYELQKQYGYQIDFIKYHQGKYKEAGQIGGSKNTDEQKIARSKVGSEYGKIYGMNNVLSGHMKKIGNISRKNGSLKKAIDAAAIKASIPVIAIDVKSKIETKYNSGSEAAKELNTHRGCVYSILKGKRKTIKGYTFRYA
jgi:hypothetical protein